MEMSQVSSVSSNNFAVGNQYQIAKVNSDQSQAQDTSQKSSQVTNEDKVTISPEAQQLAQQSTAADGDGQDVESVESKAAQLNENADNSYNANVNAYNSYNTNVDAYSRLNINA